MPNQFRQFIPEWMDREDITKSDYEQAMIALGKLNRWSRTAHTLASHTSAILARSAKLKRKDMIQIHDYGCGDGELSAQFSRILRSRGIRHQITGFDLNDRGIRFGHARVLQDSVGCVVLKKADALKINTSCDIAVSSLFMHHLTDNDLVALLKRVKDRAKYGLIFTDLRRCLYGLLLAHIATRCLTTSAVAQNDGPISVRNSRTSKELVAIADIAGLENVTIKRNWPARLVLRWQASSVKIPNE